MACRSQNGHSGYVRQRSRRLAAESLPGRSMGLVITAAVMLALILLVTRMKRVLERPTPGTPGVTTAGMVALLAVGFWLGFIVRDGATYLLLVLY